MSLYKNYVQERTNKSVLEHENGFAVYSFNETTVYIEEIYTLPDYRMCGVGAKLADDIAEIAKKRGCTKMLGSVVPSTNGSTSSLKTLLSYGFKLDSSTNNFILFSKEI